MRKIMKKVTYIGKRAAAVVLAVSLVISSHYIEAAESADDVAVSSGGAVGSTSSGTAVGATTGAAVDATPSEVITVYPFAGLECYYGQTKTFVKDEHFSLSEEPEEEIKWKLALNDKSESGSDEEGQYKFILKEDSTGFALAADAPLFTVKKYDAPDTATVTAPVYVNGQQYASEDYEIKVTAPEGYLVCSDYKAADAEWEEEYTVEKEKLVQEGENTFTYYLQSDLIDNTRKAIDTTGRTFTIIKDTIPPQATMSALDPTDGTVEGTITSSELGNYYYIVVSKDYFDNSGNGQEPGNTEGTGSNVPTAKQIRDKVASKEGVVGYGRIDKDVPLEVNISNLNPETSYVMYVLLVDQAGNESVVETVPFDTEKTALEGEVDVEGEVAAGSTLTAKPEIKTINPGEVSYQWYRVKVTSDAGALNEVFDETGGEQADDVDDDDDGDDGDDNDDGDDDDDDEIETESIKKLADDAADNDEETIESEELIEGAVSSTYKITTEDIGYRLSVVVTTENTSSSISGATDTFVPKLMPEFTMPAIASAEYSPTSTLAGIKLPDQWSWVDATIVPVCGNSGYRARFVPKDTKIYKTVIVRVKVPRTRRLLKKSMVKISKTKAYAGKAIKDNFRVKDQKKTLINKRDFKASYKNNRKLGKATVILKGTRNYKGTVRLTYRIVKKSIKSADYSYSRTKSYTGKLRTPDLVLRNDSVRMKLNRDYTVQYRNNKDIGRASAVITGKGNYKGKTTIYFSIVPKKSVIRKVSKGKGRFRLTMKHNNTAKGYYVYVSTSSSFSKKKTQQYTTTGDTFGAKGLAKGTYYVRVKAYYSKKGKIYTSAYSSKKKIKVK